MLFRNAFIYRLTKPFTLTSDELMINLASRSFTPCSGIRPSSFGWLPPLGEAEGEEDAALVHEVAGCLLLCGRREEKIVPASALNEAVAERVRKIESVEGRKLNAKERLNLRDDSLADLLPRALPRSKQVLGYLSPADNLLVVGTAVAAEAELFLNCLRDCLGDFAVVPPQIKAKPVDTFTQWLLTRKLPDHFALGDQCDLVDIEDGATVNCRRVDLDTREIRNHLEAGKHCVRLGIRWHGDMQVTVDKDLTLRQIKFDSSEVGLDDMGDPVARLDAAFAHMTLELARFLPALFKALGGETRPDA
jgi:recombination associated protein RdgC